MAWSNIPRTHCFSLSDFKEFDRCSLSFFVKHHLGQKYQLAEGSPNQALGCLLDLTIKKLHQIRGYGQLVENLYLLLKASEVEMRDHVLRNGPTSYYGAQIEFLTPELLEKAKQTFKNYYQGINGKVRPAISSNTFWEYVVNLPTLVKLWGGADALEEGLDGIPEIADYKYFDHDEGKDRLDMELMPKLYVLLCAKELKSLGYRRARFVVRLWQEPGNNQFAKEFDLDEILGLETLFKQKIEKILNTMEVKFCNSKYCKVCSSDNKQEWVKPLGSLGIKVTDLAVS